MKVIQEKLGIMSNTERIGAAVFLTGVLLYFFWSHFEAKEMFWLFPTELWVIFPLFVGGLTYILWDNKTFLQKITSMLNSKGPTEIKALEDPYVCLKKYYDSKECSMSGALVDAGKRIKVDDEWVFVGRDRSGETVYLVLNGIKNAPLNSQLISKHELVEMGYSNLKDLKRSKKSRELMDIGQSGITLRDLEGIGRLMNE